ncbi:hypothetical protein PIB30_042798 [Stylosanthes scabra]|uniref:Late embryogenesis abundant protein LEA-2 subgroup domain-containing protein n=1 Tax=Stylosanthes scabra TaxID=79078 RepID=A0ABU6RFY2_9FABA|nr:hypothetical protein [Stylosanthes scabra]
MSSKNSRMHHHHNNNVVEDHHNNPDSLVYQTYPCGYYVQSPSTQNDAESTLHSPIRSETNPTNEYDPAGRFTLCRYSSRGSNHSFLHHKKVSYDSSHDTVATTDVNRLVIIDGSGGCHEEEEEEERGLFYYDEYYDGTKKKGGWERYFSYKNSDSWAWISLQMSWRVLVSLGVALLVFYVATKPPSPNVSLQMAKILEFKLTEGVDRTGVTTKILSCNCSMNLIIDNKSRFFRLHILPPIMDMKFSILPFAFSLGPELYAESGLTIFPLWLGTKNKPMYGAGRSMQDMLDSGRGLPIVIRVSVTSSFKVVPNLINPRFHHHLECVVLLNKAYDKKHRTQVYHSTCKLK